MALKPDEFWDCTMDEAETVFRAKIDEMRFYRNCTDLLHRSLPVKPVDILAEIPLPFDHEYKASVGSDDLIAEYNRLKESGVLDG